MKSLKTIPTVLVVFAFFLDIGHQLNVGTVLFVKEDLMRKCWSPSSTKLLVTRMLIEDLLPCPSLVNMIDDDIVCNFVQYIKLVYNMIDKECNGNKRHILELAFTDALGGYMRHIVLPNVKYSFYAGTLSYSSVEKMLALYQTTKGLLKTNGHGWAEPKKDSCIKCEPHSFTITNVNDCKACEALTLYYGPRLESSEREQVSPYPEVAVPIPYFDRLIKPTALAVPLKSYPLRGVQAPWGLNLVVKYYLTGYKCMLKRANERDMKLFHDGVYSWLCEEVLPLLGDDEIYTVFGGVLRVLATLKRLGIVNSENDPLNYRRFVSGARRINLHVLRRRQSKLSDAYIRKSSIWSYTKHRKFVFGLLIFLIVCSFIGFFYICYSIRGKMEGNFGGKRFFPMGN